MANSKKYRLRGPVLASPVYGRQCKPINSIAAKGLCGADETIAITPNLKAFKNHRKRKIHRTTIAERCAKLYALSTKFKRTQSTCKDALRGVKA